MSRARPPARHRRQWPIKVTCQSVECARWQCSTPARNEDKQAFGRKRKGVRQVIKAACFARSILFGSTSGGGEKIGGVTRGEYDSAAFAAFAGGLFTIRDSEIDRQLR